MCRKLPEGMFFPPGVTPWTQSDGKQASKSSSSRESTAKKTAPFRSPMASGEEMVTPLMLDTSINDATSSLQSPLEQIAPHHPTGTEESAVPKISDRSVNDALQVLQDKGPQFTPEEKGVSDDSQPTTPRCNLDREDAELLSSNKRQKIDETRKILEEADTPLREAAFRRLFADDSPSSKRKRSSTFLQRSYTSIKAVFSSADPPTKRACTTAADPLDRPMDLNAFSTTKSGVPRKSQSATVVATQRAVLSRVDAITADNDDQNLLAL